VNVEQPEDRGILLKYVLDGVAKSEAVAINTTADGDKARTLMAGYYKYGTATLITNKGFTGGTTPVAEPCIYQYPHGFNVGGIKYEKAPTLTANGSWVENNKAIIAFAVAVEWDKEGKPTKATYGSDGKEHPVYEVKDGFITIKGKQYPIKLPDGFYIIRKLTVTECKRLQTVPEWYEFPVSDTQAYKMLGNGWTVDVIAHLISATQANLLGEEQLDLLTMME
jgi:DNA (cytosine-5)-methyltransferase 3A